MAKKREKILLEKKNITAIMQRIWLNKFDQQDATINQMSKTMTVLLLVVIMFIQAIHLAFAARFIKYQSQLDDTNGTPYSTYNSNTTSGTYFLTFFIIAAGFSTLGYALLPSPQQPASAQPLVGIQPQDRCDVVPVHPHCHFRTGQLIEHQSQQFHRDQSSDRNKLKEFVLAGTNRCSDHLVICITGSTFVLFSDNEAQGHKVKQKSGMIKT